MSLTRQQIAQRAAQELRDGHYVNLGNGIPAAVPAFIPPEITVFIHTENGLLGMGPQPSPEDVDPDLINAGKEPVTAICGAAYFSSVDSFAMVRGGHLDLTVLGAMQVDALGNLASWKLPGQLPRGMGGAMDLVAGVKRVIVAMTHVAHDGTSKIVPMCSLPLTGARVVQRIVTDLAVIDVTARGLVLCERAPGVAIDAIRRATAADLIVEGEIPEMRLASRL